MKLPTRKMIAMGAEGYMATTGRREQLADWVGAIMPGRERLADFTIVISLHPAFVLRNMGYWPAIEAFVERFILLVENKLKPWKWPRIEIEYGPKMMTSLEYLLRQSEVGVDTEGGGLNPFRAPLLCIGLADEKRAVSVDYHLMQQHRELNEIVREILATKGLIYQNGAYDIPILSRKHDFKLGKFVFDTMYGHRLLAPEMTTRKLGHDLGFMAAIQYHGMPRWKTQHGLKKDGKGDERWIKMYRKRPEETREYNAKDTITTVWLARDFRKEIKQHLHNGPALYAELHHLAEIALVMRECGEQIDPTKFAYHRKVMRGRLTKVEGPLLEVARRLGMKKFNPGSHLDTKEMFFKRLSVIPTHFTDEGTPSLKEEALQKLLVHQKPAVQLAARLLQEYRRWEKLLGTYIEGMPMACRHPTHSKCLPDAAHVVQPYLKVEGARSGRWASENPNMQNIPKPHEKDGKVISPGLRDLIIARPGYQIVEVDYSALELWILAHRAQDKRLLQWRKEGVDVHRMTVKQLYGIEIADVTDFQRDMFKRARYCYNYRGSAERMWATMVVDFSDVTLEQVVAAVESLDELHPDIGTYHHRTYEEACAKTYVEEPLSGRRKEFYDVPPTTEVASYLIQPVGATLINQALIRIAKRTNYQRWTEKNAKHRMLLQVHDALVGESKDPMEFAKIIVEEMTREVTIDGQKVSFKVDCKLGPSWGNMEKVKIAA